MRRDQIDDDLLEASFNFFFWFSRFEFALKENKLLQSNTVGAPAKPSWPQFHQKYGATYTPTSAAREMLSLHPKQQLIGTTGLTWEPVDVAKCPTELCKVVRMLTTVRNNLFHGGKRGDTDMDNKSRNLRLLQAGKIILDELADLARFQGDYTRDY